MTIEGKGQETYLYLNGISTNKEIVIDRNVSLLPAYCEPDSNAIIKVSKSEVDLGIAAIFLRQVKSQLRIVSDDPKELAILTWNSAWDILLLGAIFNCEIGFNLQCNKPSELFDENCELNITNYQLRGLSKLDYALTEENIVWINNYFLGARRLLGKDQFQTAVHSMSTYRWHSMPRIQLAILWAGIESLFNVDSEITFKLSLFIANFLARDNYDQKRIYYNEVRNLYRMRSSAVHGNKLKGDSSDLVLRSSTILNKLIIHCIENKDIPTVDDLIP
jgi:hypothetical protein